MFRGADLEDLQNDGNLTIIMAMILNAATSPVSQMNGRRFVTTGNERGLSNALTIFRYMIDGDAISGEYEGGEIVSGKIIGKATSETTIALMFQCLTIDGQLLCGQSAGTVRFGDDRLLRLDFEWSWLNGDKSGGVSHYVEIADAD